MKLHGNAALSLKGRELLVDRVLCDGGQWRGGRGAGVSERTAASGWRAIAPRVSRVWWIALRRRGTLPTGARGAGPGDRRLRRLRMTGAEIAECLDDAPRHGLGDLARIGMGKLGRLGLEPAAAL